MKKHYETPETIVIEGAVFASLPFLQQSGPNPASDDDLPTVGDNKNAWNVNYNSDLFGTNDETVEVQQEKGIAWFDN